MAGWGRVVVCRVVVGARRGSATGSRRRDRDGVEGVPRRCTDRGHRRRDGRAGRVLRSSSPPRSEPDPTTTTTTTTTVHRAAHVSLFGDSLSVQARAMLRSQGRAHGLRITVAAYFGLAPCDLAKGVRHDVLSSPGAIVLEFSGNNLTPCMKRNGKSLTGAAYYATYAHDVGPRSLCRRRPRDSGTHRRRAVVPRQRKRS